MRWTGTPVYAAPRCPGARSHTMISTPCFAQLRITGAKAAAFMFAVQSQVIRPSSPFTARFRYAHAYVHSTACSLFTPRGAHTRRTWPMRPTRISSAQYTPWDPPAPTWRSCSLSPLFSKPPALRHTPWETRDVVLFSSAPGGRTPGACPSRCTSPHALPGPISPHPRWYVSPPPRLWPLARLPAAPSIAVELPHVPHADSSAPLGGLLGGTRLPTPAKSGNARLPAVRPQPPADLCGAATAHGAAFGFDERPFLACKIRRAFVHLLATRSVIVEPSPTPPIVLADCNTWLFNGQVVLETWGGELAIRPTRDQQWYRLPNWTHGL